MPRLALARAHPGQGGEGGGLTPLAEDDGIAVYGI